MSCMLNGCSYLKELNLFNFNTNNVTNINDIFYGYSNNLKIISQDKNIKH